MPDGKRLWRTEDGSLVQDGDPRALTLAYGEDDELEGDDLKKASAPANKKSPAPTNKGG